MRRVVLSHLAVLTALLAAPLNLAHAADMALKARPAAAAVAPLPYNWTGIYVGVQGGAGWDTLKIPMPPPSTAVAFR